MTAAEIIGDTPSNDSADASSPDVFTTSWKTPSASRSHSLDALRGIAALCVVAFHWLPRVPGSDGKLSFVAGKYGVELFFLISGFVILMSAERKKSAWGFAKARFARLYPTFWICWAVTIVTVSLLGVSQSLPGWRDRLINLSMFPKFFGAGYIDGAYWTLEIELIFYAVVFGLLIVGQLRHIVFALCFLSLITSAAYWWDWRDASLGTPFAPFVFRALFLAMDGKAHLFLIGVLAFLIRQGRWTPKYLLSIPIVAAGATADTRIPGFTLFAVVTVFAMALLCDPHVKVPRWLLLLGAVSYPLYLLHFQIGKAVFVCMEGSTIAPTLLLLATGSTIIAASYAVVWIEPRIQRKKRTGSGVLSTSPGVKGCN